MGTWARNHARPSTFIRKEQTWNYLIEISVERFSKSSGKRFTLTTRCWIPPTDHTGVLTMSAVVLSPSIMPTSCNGRLITSAFYAVQPNGVRTSSGTECRFSRRKFCPRVVQHAAYDMCFGYSPIIVAYCPPLSVVFYFHPTLVGLCRASQTDFDSLYVRKEICCQIMIFSASSVLNFYWVLYLSVILLVFNVVCTPYLSSAAVRWKIEVALTCMYTGIISFAPQTPMMAKIVSEIA